MAETESHDVSKYEFSIAYDGAALATEEAHSIDVQLLAPALLAFGKLIREANAEFNGKKSTAKVRVVSDFEHKCFNINFEVVLSLIEQLKTLLGSDDTKTAKEVLQWLGLLGVPSVGTLSYLAYLRWKGGRKVADVKPLTDSDSTGVVEVTIDGDGNSVHVHNHIYNLSENPRALRATRDTFLPLGQDGFDNVKVRQGDTLIEEIGTPDVEAIVKSCNVGIEESKETEPEIEVTPAWLSVYSPVFDPAAPNWRFRLGTDIIYADISSTDIAQQTLTRGGVAVDDAYQVRLEITREVTQKGTEREPTYKVLEVIRFVPAGPALRQATLFDPEQP
ncbi:hypothetical protein [Bradyrhizobium sp. SZCCHNR2026]|uniref:hypothetical protein n=1 Tax=Bradyrhizobium sp. SZCCHNR2026 TaxID=3057381 RepID=UPI00291683B5|nr:hypothetical protein [Bradyrhizobium sp. SZCCHNR2026]